VVSVFLFTAGQAILVYSIAIPFFLVDYSSLPMTVGILTGLMWLPFSWIIKHWVGIFHTLIRIIAVLTLWYLLPEYRFIAIPFAIVLIYIITLIIIKNRKKTK
jgi:phage shock protein PspC (stress-responsive transcriptional regulator)